MEIIFDSLGREVQMLSDSNGSFIYTIAGLRIVSSPTNGRVISDTLALEIINSYSET